MNKTFIPSQHFFGIVLILLLAGCTPLASPATSTLDVNSASTQTTSTFEAHISQTAALQPTITLPSTVYPTASPWPVATGSPVPTLAVFMTPDSAEVKRWKEYEDALAKAIFPPATISKHANPGKFLCEWEFLGQTDQKVYVWAVCMSILSNNGDPVYNLDALAIIHINIDGTIQSVEIPRAGSYSQDIHKLFPLDVQKMYFDKLIDFRRLSDHLRMRIKHPEEPPLVVLDATQVP
jgi:hypothetical protein